MSAKFPRGGGGGGGGGAGPFLARSLTVFAQFFLVYPSEFFMFLDRILFSWQNVQDFHAKYD